MDNNSECLSEVQEIVLLSYSWFVISVGIFPDIRWFMGAASPGVRFNGSVVWFLSFLGKMTIKEKQYMETDISAMF